MGRWLDEAKTIFEYGGRGNLQNPQNPVSKVLKVGDTPISKKFFPEQQRCWPAWHPLPAPRIEGREPWGSDKLPPRYAAAWEAFCAQCPASASMFDWEMAAFDAAIFLGDWCLLARDSGWTAGDIFDAATPDKPGGLVWAIKGHPVLALGPQVASLQGGGIWKRRPE